ncbi:hypothetical protein [Massilia sp. DWR3-1-1]|uniref:hypothetical protein n=1 Tax=Massilia sp. DWR3-1-1 TaxID=2804559 RepID=UPI003CE84A47
MEEVLKSFKAQMYDRVSSPLTFSFVLSWCAWNYRFLLLIVGTNAASEKFAYVDAHLFATWQDYAFRGFLFPLCSALCYIYLYPAPARKVYEFTQSEAVKMKKAQQRIEDETPISEEEAAELRANMRKEKRDRADELDRADKLIKQLQDDLARLEVKPTTAEILYPSNSSSTELPTLTHEQYTLLHQIANFEDDFFDKNYFNSNADTSLANRKNNVDVLLERKLVNENFSSRGRTLDATPLGRKLLRAGHANSAEEMAGQ